MREWHVFFLYVLYPVFGDFVEINCKDNVEDATLGTIRSLLMAIHLTKGFSSEVRTDPICFF